MEFMEGTAKYTWQDYKTNEQVLSELKINPVVKKIQNYRNKYAQHVRRIDSDRLPLWILKYQTCGEKKPRRTLH
jgi:hypothetical protein